MVRAFKLQSIAKTRLFSPFSHSILIPPKTDELSVGRYGNIVQLRGKSYAASAASDPLPDRSRKRVPKARRKAMVESYVDEYRAINDGKFPTISDAVKQVGGSYYVIREILQELKYDFRTSSMRNQSEYSVRKEQVKDDELLAEVQEHISISVAEDAKTEMGSQSKAFKDVRADDTGRGTVEAVPTRSETVTPSEDTKANVEKQKNNKDLEGKDDHSVTTSTQSHFQKEITLEEDKSEEKLRHEVLQETYNIKVEQMKENLHSTQGKHKDEKEIKAQQGNHLDVGAAQGHLQDVKLNKEDNSGKAIASEALYEAHIPQSKTGHSPRSLEMEKLKIDTPERQSIDTDSPHKPTFWGNLKSFADGIVKIWRKL